MDKLTSLSLPVLFERFSTVFAEQKDALIALDSKVGDSDLGLTMSKGFAAAAAAVSALEDANIETQFKTAGVAIARAAPSTMGTLMATGFMRGSTAVKDCEALETIHLAHFWVAFCEGVIQRGRVKVGDKTVVDVLHPIAEIMTKQAESGVALTEALNVAYETALEALESTKDLVAQHGKAAAFQEKTRGIQDAGSTVAVILIKTMADFINEI